MAVDRGDRRDREPSGLLFWFAGIARPLELPAVVCSPAACRESRRACFGGWRWSRVGSGWNCRGQPDRLLRSRGWRGEKHGIRRVHNALLTSGSSSSWHGWSDLLPSDLRLPLVGLHRGICLHPTNVVSRQTFHSPLPSPTQAVSCRRWFADKEGGRYEFAVEARGQNPHPLDDPPRHGRSDRDRERKASSSPGRKTISSAACGSAIASAWSPKWTTRSSAS